MTNPTIPQRIQELRELLAPIAEGDWKTNNVICGDYDGCSSLTVRRGGLMEDERICCCTKKEYADFIAASHKHVPYLLEEIERLNRKLEKAKDEFCECGFPGMSCVLCSTTETTND